MVPRPEIVGVVARVGSCEETSWAEEIAPSIEGSQLEKQLKNLKEEKIYQTSTTSR
jgi:hypothetical protein